MNVKFNDLALARLGRELEIRINELSDTVLNGLEDFNTYKHVTGQIKGMYDALTLAKDIDVVLAKAEGTDADSD